MPSLRKVLASNSESTIKNGSPRPSKISDPYPALSNRLLNPQFDSLPNPISNSQSNLLSTPLSTPHGMRPLTPHLRSRTDIPLPSVRLLSSQAKDYGKGQVRPPGRPRSHPSSTDTQPPPISHAFTPLCCIPSCDHSPTHLAPNPIPRTHPSPPIRSLTQVLHNFMLEEVMDYGPKVRGRLTRLEETPHPRVRAR